MSGRVVIVHIRRWSASDSLSCGGQYDCAQRARAFPAPPRIPDVLPPRRPRQPLPGRSAPALQAMFIVYIGLGAAALLSGCRPASLVPANAAAFPVVSSLDISAVRSLRPGAGEQAPIRYTLSAPALVRVRIVDADTPGIILRTLVDWEPRKAGPHQDMWDGLDRCGEATDVHRVSILVRAEPPLTGDSVSMADASADPCAQPASCRDLSVRLHLPEGSDVSGSLLVRAAVEAAAPVPEYHVVVYLDGTAIHDGRVRKPYYEAPFDTRAWSDGEHWLAVTFNDLCDHAGSDWTWLRVRNAD